MADNYRSRPVGDVIDHPALENYEATQLLGESFAAFQARGYTTGALLEQLTTGCDVFCNAPNDRFIVHERDLVLEEGPSEDPLENDDGYVSDEGLIFDLDIDEVLEMRQEDRRENLIIDGFELGPSDIPPPEMEPSVDLFAATSLAVPELVRSEPPPMCRAERAEEICFRGLTSEAFESMFDAERAERERIQRLESSFDRTSEILAAKRLELSHLKKSLQILANGFCAEDPAAYAKWQTHIVNAQKSARSHSQSRAWIVAMWFRKGLPRVLWRAVRDLASCELSISANSLRLRRVKAKLNYDNVEAPCCLFHTYCDDETFHEALTKQFRGKDLYFGDEYPYDVPNGFSDYLAPEGKEGQGASLAQHIMASLETRKIRVEHEPNEAKRTALISSYLKFLDKAREATDVEVNRLGEEDAERPRPDTPPRFSADSEALIVVQRALWESRNTAWANSAANDDTPAAQ